MHPLRRLGVESPLTLPLKGSLIGRNMLFYDFDISVFMSKQPWVFKPFFRFLTTLFCLSLSCVLLLISEFDVLKSRRILIFFFFFFFVKVVEVNVLIN